MMELLESSSSWIVALGKTVLNSLWLGLFLLTLIKALLAFIPERFPAYRYRTALTGMILFALGTAILFLKLYEPLSAGLISPADRTSFPGVRVHGFSTGGERSVLIYSSIALSYFFGMAFYLAVLLFSLREVHAIRKSGGAATGIWLHVFNEFGERAGLRRKVDFLVSSRIVSPFLTGVIKPAIVVPTSMLSQLSFREIESILMHELYHLKRLDHLVNLIQMVMEIIFFFNPVIWILSKVIRHERERACDDLVVAGHSSPLVYAKALYSLSMYQQTGLSKGIAATGRGKGELKLRIERILKPNTMKTNIQEKLNAILMIAFGLILVVVVSGFSSGFSITQHNDMPRDALPVQVKEEGLVSVGKLLPDQWASSFLDPDTLSKAVREEIKLEMEELKNEVEQALKEIDWEDIKDDVEDARRTVMEEIDWDEIFTEMESARSAMEEIDWEDIRIEVEEARIQIDSILKDFHKDMDFHKDIDQDSEIEKE